MIRWDVKAFGEFSTAQRILNWQSLLPAADKRSSIPGCSKRFSSALSSSYAASLKALSGYVRLKSAVSNRTPCKSSARTGEEKEACFDEETRALAKLIACER
jgi:hypothetical protein